MNRLQASWLAISLLAYAVCPAATLADNGADNDAWKGSLRGAYVWQDTAGSEDSFRSQYNQREGFFLEDFSLDFTGNGSLQHFTLDAHGFGRAWPTQTARVKLDFRQKIGAFFDYDRRESFFATAGSEFDRRSEDAHISRFKAGVVFDSEPMRTSVILRRHDRSGRVDRTLFAHNDVYPVTLDLDESMTEGLVRVESRTLPVRIEFEQALTRYERKNRRIPSDPNALSGTNTNLLLEAQTGFEDTQDVPSSRLTASYANPGFEGVGTVFYSKPDLDTTGIGSTGIGIGGGAIGRFNYIDDLVGSAQADSLYAALNLGFRLNEALTLRVTTEVRDASTNTSLLGQRLLRATPPGGSVIDIASLAIDERGRYSSRDNDAHLRLEYRRPTWSLWGGGLAANREVAWLRLRDDTPFRVSRETDGFVAGATWDPGRYFGLNFEYEEGDFTGFVFRVDPGTVERTSLRLRSRLAGGWQLSAHGRYETGDNPTGIAGRDQKSIPYGVAANWSADSGDANFGVDIERVDLHTDTGIVLPDGSGDRSIYDLDLYSTTLSGGATWGKVRLHGTGTRLIDNGETWPLDSWNVKARLDVQANSRIEYGLFADYMSYGEDRADLDDYDVTRVGLSLLWRFE